MHQLSKWLRGVFPRRNFLAALGLALAHLALRGLSWAKATYARVDDLLVRSVEHTPRVDLKAWSLKAEGLVEKPISMSFDEVKGLPQKVVVRDFICVEGWGLETQKWEGVHLKEIFSRLRISPKARFVTFHSTGGKYTDSLSIQEALEPDTLLAYKRNGKDLPPENGFPLRLIIPRMYAYKGPKWVERIVFTEKQETGYWEKLGYSPDGSIPGLKN